LKPDGSAVAVDEPLFELETDKATQDIPAPAAGVVSIKVKEGEVVKVGAVVASIEPDGKAAVPAAKPEAKKPSADGPPSTEPKVSPAARQIAADSKLDPAKIPATGPKGTVTKEDAVLASGGRQAPVE